MKKPLKYFSCFSGIGAAECAILGVFPDAVCVGYSEIDPVATGVYRYHFSDHVNYGDITKININRLPDFDLLIGGSPCQGFSAMNKNGRKGLKDPRSSLIYYFFNIIKKKKPRWFILENVGSMSNQIKDEISQNLGVKPVSLNSKQVSAQYRNRIYWVNFPVLFPFNKHQDITDQCLPSILDSKKITRKLPDTTITIKGVPLDEILPKSKKPYALHHLAGFYYKPRTDCKSAPVLTTLSTCSVIWDGSKFRQLTPEEMEALQGFPKGWTDIPFLTKTDRIKCIGNAFTIQSIICLLLNLENHIKQK